MKKINTLGLIIALILIFFGCEEIKDPAGQRDAGVVPLISDVTGIFISGELNSSVQFTVNLESGMTVDNAQIQVSQQANLEREKIADIASFPATVTLNLGEVTDKLGTINKGDLIFVEVVTTKNGITTRSNASLSLIVFCEFNEALAVGSFHSVSSDWGSEGDITITSDPLDPYTVYVSGLEAIEGVNEDLGPLVMHIDPLTFAVTADKTVIASEAWWGDTNIAYEGSGTYNSCTGVYSMRFDISATEGDYGLFSFTITRK